MSLNIKDPEAHKLAEQLAKETGETMTAVVIEALRERLEQIRRDRKKDAVYKELLAISKRTATLLEGPPIDHAELLYDERGLPK